MLHHIEVTNFRGLERFRMERLGRVNLLVGTNNCGKTSVLEAIESLMTQGAWGSWEPLLRSLRRRGEGYHTELELAHLFHGHRVTPGASFKIEARDDHGSNWVEVGIRERSSEDPHHYRPSRYENDEAHVLGPNQLYLKWMRAGVENEMDFPLSRRGGFSNFFDAQTAHLRLKDINTGVVFVTTGGLSHGDIASLLEDAMLTPEEDTLLASLRTIEPDIERISPVGSGQNEGEIAVKLAGQRVPLGSLGDGIWRFVAIAMALVKASGGVLLVDEIDTGLHYTVLERMWRLVSETAARLDVQVFATTHSRDCYESLAAIAHPGGHDVTIQRIERGKPVAVAFSEDEILQAAQRGIEVR